LESWARIYRLVHLVEAVDQAGRKEAVARSLNTPGSLLFVLDGEEGALELRKKAAEMIVEGWV
jgi:hypothetical protein